MAASSSWPETMPVLPRHVTCYKAFYRDRDGLLHTLYGNQTVVVRERLTCHSNNEPIVPYVRGIHFCVTPESCMDVYTSERLNEWTRVIAIVTPDLDDCVFDGAFTYCTRSVVVESVMDCAHARAHADVYTEAKLARVPPDADNYLVLNWAARVGNCRATKGVIGAMSTFPRGWNHQARMLAFAYGQSDVEQLLAGPTMPRYESVRRAMKQCFRLCEQYTPTISTDCTILAVIGFAVVMSMFV